MAETEDPKEGGYVVEPKHKKDKNDDWIRIKDKSYGKEKYKPIPKGYFESIVYYVQASDRPIETIYKKDEYDDRVHFRYDKRVDTEFREPKLYKAESLHSFSPYPFDKNCSIVGQVFYKNIFLHDDWMQELILLCKRTLEYFNDENQYKNNSYFNTENRVKQDLRYFKETFDKEGLKGLKDLRKIWGYEKKETLPDRAEIEIRHKNGWEKFHKNNLKFLKDFLKRYERI